MSSPVGFYQATGSAMIALCEIAGDAGQNQVADPERQTGELDPIAGAKRDKNKDDDHRSDNEHPVLAVEAKKGKVLDQKMQRPRASIFHAE